MIPVPYRRADYQSYSGSDTYAVEVDLAAIGSFAIAEDGSQVLWTDLQCGPHRQERGRMGSGRSGFFQGAYLKGIGRTLLAGNWNDAADIYHGSGHMYASAAVREFFATSFLRSKRSEATVVPCFDLLLRSMDAPFRERHRELCGKRGYPMPRIDERWQAISVKRGDFGRPGNLIALMSRSNPTADALFGISECILRWCDRDVDDIADHSATPSRVISALAAGIRRGAKNIIIHNKLGLSWGSIPGNYTLDGRFLDLENACFLPPSFFGVVALRGEDLTTAARCPEAGRGIIPVGMEVLHYAAASRQFIERFRSELLRLRDAACESTCRAWTVELIRSCDETFNGGHFLYDPKLLRKMATQPVIEAGCDHRMAIAGADRAIRWLHLAGCGGHVHERMPLPDCDGRRPPAMEWMKVDLDFPQIEPIAHVDLWMPHGAYSDGELDWSEISAVNSVMFSVFESGSPGELFDIVEATEAAYWKGSK